MTESSSQNTGASIQFKEDASYASRIVGTTKHIPVRVESFALKIGKLCVDGEAFLEGSLTLNPYNIHKIRQIPAGTELLLDDGVTKLLISNVFDDSAVKTIWTWYHDQSISVECDRQMLPTPMGKPVTATPPPTPPRTPPPTPPPSPPRTPPPTPLRAEGAFKF